MRAFDKLAWQREYRKRTGNSYTQKYEKTVGGFLMRAYRNMKSRTAGSVKPHLYKGLTLLSKETFYSWSLRNAEFNRLYNAWASSGYAKTLTPSVNRRDTSLGYSLGNIEWVTHSENSRQGALSRHRKAAA